MLRKQKGITLIALVITIIVLLILAGVSISLVVGDNGVLTQATSAVTKTKEARAMEDVSMAWGSAGTQYWADWAKDFTVDKSEYFKADKLNEYAGQGTILSSESNGDGTYTVQYQPDDEEKVYTFLVDEDGNITRKFLGEAINTEKYGYLVNGYVSKVYRGQWRLFYQDADNTYIIAEPETTEYKPSDYYSSYEDGSAVSEEGRNLNYKLKTGTFFTTSNTNPNMRAVAWLTDTSSSSKWSQEYLDNAGKGEYAIGGPTIELFVASFNATHESSTASVSVGTNGYTCSGLTSSNSLGTAGDYHGIYRFNSTDSRRYWWLASPGGNGSSLAWYVNSFGGYLNSRYVASDSRGVRPVVSIPTSSFSYNLTDE